MLQRLALVALFAVIWATDGAGQVLDDALVPRGRVRVEVAPVFTSWGSRFGRDASGATRRERLGEDLTTDAAQQIFPGAESLRSAIAAMSSNPGYSGVLGETEARVTMDITRVELGGHLGVLDWLTIGAVLPVTRTRTSLDVHFRADSVGGDLGNNPTVTNATGVSSFLSALASAESAAQTRASQVCASSPGSGQCTSAQALAARTSSFRASASSGYAASPFFPHQGSATATSLTNAVSVLSADLVAAGLAPISVPMQFATTWVNEGGFWVLPSTGSSGLQGSPLGSIKAPWNWGDFELSATVRLLEGGAPDSAGNAPALAYRVLATFLARLPTGHVEAPDTFLDVGTGDGQTDLEGRVQAQLTIGGRFGLHAAARYGVQQSRTLVRRVAPPEVVLAPASTRAVLDWTPGSYFGVEVAPAWHLADELTLSGEWRVFRKYRDEYELAGSSVGAPLDPSVLEIESGMTVHEVGGSLHYDTITPRFAGASPIQARFRYLRAVAGGGGQTPVTTRVELGVRLFRRFWGPQ